MIYRTLEQVYRNHEIFECYDEDTFKFWYEVPKLNFQHHIDSINNAQMYISDALEKK